MPNHDNKAPVISFVREFLKKFRPSTTLPPDYGDSGLPWIRTEGLLFPTREEKVEYREILNRLYAQVAEKDDISLDALDRALRTAVFHVADLSNTQEKRRRDRVRRAAEVLEAFAHRPPRDFEIGIEVRGLDADTLPFEFGLVRFERMSEAFKRIDKVRGSIRTDDSGVSDAADGAGTPTYHDAIIGSLTVSARDHKAAEVLGEREVRTTVECLNLFLPYVPHFSSPIYVLTERTGSSSFDRLICDPDGQNLSYSHAPSPDIYSFAEVRGKQRPALERVQQLLKSRCRSEVDELLLQAVRWGGRAFAAHALEDSVVFAFTALECALVPRGKEKILDRLVPRLAWAISDTASVRGQVSGETKRAYDLRSRIIHDGRIEVPASERAWVQGVTLIALLKLLFNREVSELDTRKDLEEYLRKQTAKPDSDG